MAMPRKSLEEHRLQGTEPHYETKTIASHIEGGCPKCPSYLTPVAKRKFRELVRELDARQTLTRGDGSLIEMAAVLWDRWLTAARQVEREGAVVTATCYAKNGERYERQKLNYALTVAQNSEKQLATILASLGLSVNHRDRAKPTAPSTENPEAAAWAKVTTVEEWEAFEARRK